MRTGTAKVVSFSGIDGAGKSTQIQALQFHLRLLGFRSTLYTFWDDVVVFSRLRESLSHTAFKGDKGAGSPEKPISRRDKNVTSWFATGVRLFFYLLDALSLRLTFGRSHAGADFIIFDRFIYDELANLPLHSGPIRFYVRMLLSISPQPDIAYLVDAEPEAARIRKPEYPLNFLRQNRDAYIKLSHLVRGMTVVGSLSVEETTSEIMESISKMCLQAGREALELQSQCPAGCQDPNASDK
jgi:thymidylate kinase